MLILKFASCLLKSKKQLENVFEKHRLFPGKSSTDLSDSQGLRWGAHSSVLGDAGKTVDDVL